MGLLSAPSRFPKISM